ncbi:MAG: DUF6152 family protein [Pseudomonadota bacterium]
MRKRALSAPAARIAVALAASLAALAAAAHHGWSEYDGDKPLEVSGVIRESGYEHPHGRVRLETPGKTWLVAPSRMAARGLREQDLRPGTQARVTGYPHRTKPEEMRAERITVGGRTVALR